MHLEIHGTLRLSQSTTERPHQLVTIDGDEVVVASGRRVTVYDAQLNEVESVACSDEISCVRRAGGHLFVSTGSRIVELDRAGGETELVRNLWADPNDAFAVNADMVWFVDAGPAACVFDLVHRTLVARFAFGDAWSGGSFAFWPAGPGAVIVAAPMDRKVARLSLVEAPAMHEISCQGHVIGVTEAGVVSVGDTIDVHELPSGILMKSTRTTDPPQSAATISHDLFVFGTGGIQRMATEGLETVGYLERGDRPIFHGAPLGSDIVLVVAGGELVVGTIR